jgi:quercetin dioxygenase-like cupin family protein
MKVIMKNIELLKHLEIGEISESEKFKEVKEIFNGTRRRIVEVKLRNNSMMAKHKAIEPITVLCLAGTGVFRAGKDLEDEQKLQAGTLITLEAGIEHEVVAEPALNLLVTKFKE